MAAESRPHDNAAPGFLSSVLRPVFTLATAAAVALPMMAAGAQAAPVDSHAAADLAATFNRPAITQVEQNNPAGAVTVLQPAGPVTEYHRGPQQPSLQQQILQYGVAALTGAAFVGGVAGIVATDPHGRSKPFDTSPAANMLVTSMVWGTPFPGLKMGR